MINSNKKFLNESYINYIINKMINIKLDSFLLKRNLKNEFETNTDCKFYFKSNTWLLHFTHLNLDSEFLVKTH